MTSSTVTTLYEGDEATAVAQLVSCGRVLDCGCGSGRIANAIRPSVSEVWGIELSPAAATLADAVCDKVIRGNLMEPTTWVQLNGITFDAVLFIHVLEHLVEPAIAIKAAIAQLRPGGSIIVALPNVANWRVRWELARGRWEYREEGIMDRTHVKFYTHKTATEFLNSQGLEIRASQTYVAQPAGSSLRRACIRRIRRAFPLLFSHSFLFRTVPS